MKPTRDTFTVESTVGTATEAISMTIDPAAMQHIMGILTDLYADPEMAVLREYATNARDAHIAAGSTAPIRVELPTDLRPMLTITDEGIGLDAADIRAIYSQYGASTKRDTNEATGMLGLGCKSALAYADQFTLIGRKAGRQVTVAVSRDEAGAGVMNLLDERDTDAPNGVAVQIPTRRGNDLDRKAGQLFRFWPEGSVLVNGEAPERIAGYELSPGMLVVDKSEVDARCIVVMGGVPYPAPQFFDGEHAKLAGHKALIAWVDIGAVHFAPSREALMDTPTTRRTLEQLREKFNTAKQRAMQRDVDAATTRGEAMAAQVAAQDALAIDATATWRGEDVPDRLELPITGADRWWYLHNTASYRRSRSQHVRVRYLEIKQASRAVWVLGFTNATWTAAMRDKLDRYCGPDGPASDVRVEEGQVEFVLTRAEELPSVWLSEVRTLRWADIRAWKDPNAPTAQGGGLAAYAGTYGTWKGHSFVTRYEAADLAADVGPIFWMLGSTAAYEEAGAAEAAALRAHFGEDTRLVVFAENRRDKFLRTFPEARAAEDGRREAAAAWNRLAELWTQELYARYERHKSYLRDTLPDAVPNPMANYPLLPEASGQRGTVVEHMLTYVNAVYAKENT